MTRPPENLPDPWLFDSEALLTQLDRIREIVMNIPISDVQSTHFGINRAVTAIWDLEQHLRYLLHLHREGQRQIARAHDTAPPAQPPVCSTDKNIVHIATSSQPASALRKTHHHRNHKKSSVSGHWRTSSPPAA